MAKVLKKQVASTNVDDKVEAMKAKLADKATAPTAEKGSLAPEATEKEAPKKASVKAPKVAKEKKSATVLDNGLTYGLLSRVRNAFPASEREAKEAGHDVLSMVDGRGRDLEISSVYVGVAEELGGAEYLKTVRTSHVRAKLFPKAKAEKPVKAEETTSEESVPEAEAS